MATRPVKTGLTPLAAGEEDPNIHYPCSDDEPMAESDAQRRAIIDTSETLIQHFAHRPDVYVSADMLVYYEMNNPDRSLAPDVFVVFGVADHPRGSFFVWREGKAPDFILEVASPGTYIRDAREKRDIYAAMGVTEYWRFDPTNGDYFQPPLVGELLNRRGQYEPVLVADHEGILRGRCQTLGLDICVRDGEIRLFDPVSQTWLRNLQEETAARLEEAAARQAAEARVQALERLLREHGITPPDAAA